MHIPFRTHALCEGVAELLRGCQVFNIGADETAAKGVCTVESSFGIERKMIEAIKSKYGKTPEGWEEIFFDAGAATMDTIVNAWCAPTNFMLIKLRV